MKLAFPRLNFKQRRGTPIANTYLVLYEHCLIHVGTGQHYQLDLDVDNNQDIQSEKYLPAAHIAAAAHQLLPRPDKKQTILLGLPACEFVATPVRLSGVSLEDLPAALSLQLPMLLPGLSEPLLQLPITELSQDGHYTVLWLPSQRADALYAAFKAENLFLQILLPRPLMGLEIQADDALHVICDKDSQLLTWLSYQNGHLAHWMNLSTQEYLDPTFREQLDEILEQQFAGNLQHAKDMSQVSTWIEAASPPAMICQHALVPPAAKQQRLQARQKKQRLLLKSMAVICVLAVLLLVGGVVYKQHQTQIELQDLQAQTHDIRSLRQAVLDIEDHFGAIHRFPDQNIVFLLDNLNSMIPKHSWINTFKIENGTIELEGYSKQPVLLLETLTANPQFTDVAFNKIIDRSQTTKNGEKFGISLRLKSVDVPAYMEQYFPDALDNY